MPRSPRKQSIDQQITAIQQMLDNLKAQVQDTAAVTTSRSAATGDLPFAEYAGVQSSQQTAARRLFKTKGLDELKAAKRYEQKTANRKVIVKLIDAAIARLQKDTAAAGPLTRLPKTRPASKAAGARRRGRQVQAQQVDPSRLPFPEYATVVSNQQTAARRLFKTKTVDELKGAKKFEARHDNRKVIIKLLDNAIAQATKQPRAATPARAAAPTRGRQVQARQVAADELPFPEYKDVASSQQTAARRLFKTKTVDELKAAKKFEARHDNRKVIIKLLDNAIAQATKQPRAAAPAAKGKPGRPSLADRPADLKGTPPVDDYGSWSLSTDDPARNTRKRIREIDDSKLIDRLIAFENKQDTPRKVVLKLLENRKRTLSSGTRASGRPARQAAAASVSADSSLPFSGYDQIRSSQQTQARRILAEQPVEKLQAALAYERANNQRVQIIDLITKAIERKQSTTVDLPFPKYKDVASSKQTASRRILNAQSADVLRDTLKFEREHGNRKQVIAMIEAALAKKDGSASSARQSRTAQQPAVSDDLPFPEYKDVASSKQTLARRILRERSPAELEAALTFERANANRKQIVKLIDKQLSMKKGITPSRGKTVVDESELPFPEYKDVASSKQTASRRLLRSRSEQELLAARQYETTHANRKQIVKLIDDALAIVRGEKTGKPGRQPKKIANGSLPFPGYDEIQAAKRTEARAKLLAQDVNTLQAALTFEEQHADRSIIKKMIRTVIEQKEKGTVRRTRGSGAEPIENYDSIPAKVLVETIQRGSLDDMLDRILTYERDNGARAEVIKAVEERQSQPRDEGQIVSPTGRVWKGKEPWVGYGTLDHTDRDALRAAYERRSSGELRRVEGAEDRQTFPSAEAKEVAAQVLTERERQPATV